MTQPQLLGGWRVAEPFGGGGLNGGGMAIDWATRTLYVYVNNPNENRVGVAVFDLPEHGTEADTSAWPTLLARDFLPAWWDFDNPDTAQGPFCQGLFFGEGKLWAVTRDFYPVLPADTVVVKAADGERRVYGAAGQPFAGIGRQAFGNFVKGPGLGTYRLGCGGHETGQGTVNGPCLAELDGTVRITYASLPWDVGPNLENWNTVAPRPPDYWPAPGVGDTWLAWAPRDTDGDGELEGRWAADHIDSGGLTLADGVYFWTYQGTGEKNYTFQNTSASPVFAASWDLHRTRVYRYDPNTYKLLGYEDWPDEHGQPMRNPIRGSELGPDGLVYLLEGYAWMESGDYAVNPIVRVYDMGHAPSPPAPPQPPTPPPPPSPPDPQPVLACDFAVDLAAVRAGEPFGLYPSGAARYYYVMGDGRTGEEWGDTMLPTAPERPGTYTFTVLDAADYSRTSIASYTVAPVPQTLNLSVSVPYMAGDAHWFESLGVDVTDEGMGVIAVPDGSSDVYTFHPAWDVGGKWGIHRVRGRPGDPLGRYSFAQTEVVTAQIAGYPAVYDLPNLLYPGPVHVVQRHGKPDRLLMLGFADEYRLSGNRELVYGSLHWFYSDTYGKPTHEKSGWTYAGTAAEHAVSRADWLANNWVPYPGSKSGPYSAHLNGAGSLLPAGEELWIARNVVNGPLYGPGGDPRNYCPLAWSMVKPVELCDRIDAGMDTRDCTRTWYQGAWSTSYDGPADNCMRSDTLFYSTVRWCPDLGTYIVVTQRGRRLHIAATLDLFDIPPGQLLYEADREIGLLEWTTPGDLSLGPNYLAFQSWREPPPGWVGEWDYEFRVELLAVSF